MRQAVSIASLLVIGCSANVEAERAEVHSLSQEEVHSLYQEPVVALAWGEVIEAAGINPDCTSPDIYDASLTVWASEDELTAHYNAGKHPDEHVTGDKHVWGINRRPGIGQRRELHVYANPEPGREWMTLAHELYHTIAECDGATRAHTGGAWPVLDREYWILRGLWESQAERFGRLEQYASNIK